MRFQRYGEDEEGFVWYEDLESVDHTLLMLGELNVIYQNHLNAGNRSTNLKVHELMTEIEEIQGVEN
jgi:hypothetical protein